MIWLPISSNRFMISSRCSFAVSRRGRTLTRKPLPFTSIGSGPIAHAPTIQAARAVEVITSPPTPVEFSP